MTMCIILFIHRYSPCPCAVNSFNTSISLNWTHDRTCFESVPVEYHVLARVNTANQSIITDQLKVEIDGVNFGSGHENLSIFTRPFRSARERGRDYSSGAPLPRVTPPHLMAPPPLMTPPYDDPSHSDDPPPLVTPPPTPPTNIQLQPNPSYCSVEMSHQQLMSSRLENESKYVNL